MRDRFLSLCGIGGFLNVPLRRCSLFCGCHIPSSPSLPDLDVNDLYGLLMSRLRRICVSRAPAGQNVGATRLAVGREEAMMKAFCESPLAEIRGAIGNVFQHRGDSEMTVQWVLRAEL